MQNPILKFRQSSCVLEKPEYLSEKYKIWRTPTTVEFNMILLRFCTHFCLTNVYKRVCGIFQILLRSWVINKSGFCEYVETSYFLI